jgi:peptidyl-prolyl cis-trans isomerase C
MMPRLIDAQQADAVRRPPVLGLATAAAAALLIALSPAWAQTTDPVVARVNGAEIRASDVAVAEEDLGEQLAQMPPEAKREYVVTYLSDTLLVAQAAEKKKLGDSENFKRRLAFLRNKLLSEALLDEDAKSAVTDDAMRKIYDEAAKKMGGEQEVHARHILVESEDEAKAVLAELQKGADFAELAKQKSKDPGGAQGGDLGYFTKDQMVPEFAEVAFKLEPGKLSDPVKSQFGWHIIKVEDKRARPVPEFDKVKDQIQAFLVRKAQTETVTKLRAEGKIERLDAPAAKTPDAPPAAEQPKK